MKVTLHGLAWRWTRRKDFFFFKNDIIITVVTDLHVKQKPEPKNPESHFDVCVLATGTHRPGSGCCTSCMRSRRPLYVQTPLQPHPPSPDELASRLRTRRTVPVDKLMDSANTHWMSHHRTAALGKQLSTKCNKRLLRSV